MKRMTIGIVVLYLLAYALFRAFNTETWARDGRDYVIYPQSGIFLYMLFRPMAYLDKALTGTGSHIGPHAEAVQ